GAVEVLAVADGKASAERAIAIPTVPAAGRRPAATPPKAQKQPPPPGSNNARPGGEAPGPGSRGPLLGVHPPEGRPGEELGAGRGAREIPVGVAPCGGALSPDGKTAYVSNWGGRRPRPGDATAYSSGTAVVVDPGTGVASTGTISVVDVAAGNAAEIEVG